MARASHIHTQDALGVVPILVIVALIQLVAIVSCQVSDDLINKPHSFPIHNVNLRPGPSQTPAFKHNFQRSSLVPGPFRYQEAHQQPAGAMAAQASASAGVYSEPPVASAVAAAASNHHSQHVSNIEQMMKNAWARTAQLNSVAGSPPIEPRQDSSPIYQQVGRQIEPLVASKPAATFASSPLDSATESGSSEAGPVNPSTTTALSNESSEQQQQEQPETATTSGHETVYSDQRFANLFARRNIAKKSKLQPHEQVKAKPTLPSFIKSLPDPKQFSNAPASGGPQERPVNQVQASSSINVRTQQQPKINFANQAKKAVITSNSAANASNKRANSLAQNNKTANPPAPTSNLNLKNSNYHNGNSNSNNKIIPLSNKPVIVNRSPGASSPDPSSVIAMARKRLLANNALESAKSKQQQQQKQTSN